MIPAVKVEIAFNAGYSTPVGSRTWTDVTSYVRRADGIDITYGRGDERSQADPNTLKLTLVNSDGRFTPGLASSPYYPNVKIGRPIRVTATPNGNPVPNPSFEVNTTGWAASDGAAISRVTTQFDHGVASCAVTSAGALAGANTTTGTGGFAVVAGQTYTAQIRAKAATVARNFSVSLLWYTAAGASAGVSTSSLVSDSTSAWTSNTVTAVAPPTAAFAAVWARWVSAAAEVHWLDSVMVNTGSVALPFTTTPPTPSTRFVGYIDEWPLEWPAVVETFATSRISATSRTARLGADRQLKSVVEEEIFLPGPRCYYTLGEAEGATTAADSSGNASEPLQVVGSGNPVTFGSATGPGTDGLTAADFDGGKYLQGTTPPIPNRGMGVVVAFNASTIPATDLATIIEIPTASGGIHINVSGSTLRVGGWRLGGGGSVLAHGATAAITTGRTYVAAVTTSTGANMIGYLDGVSVGSDATWNLVSSASSTDIAVGQGIVVDNFLAASPTFDGVIAHVAVFDFEPTPTQIAAISNAMLTGFAGETPGARIARYASYADVAAAEVDADAGVSPMAHIDTTGTAVMDVLRLVEATEGGVLFDGRDGTLEFRDRASRYLAATALTLDVDSGEVGASYSPKLDRASLLNDVTATTTDGTVTARATDETSVADYGRKNLDLTLATTDANEPHAAAWWRVNTYSEPRARAPRLEVDIAHQSAALQATVLTLDVGSKITVTNLPSQSDAASKSFFVEGYSEHIGETYSFDLNVSPTDGYGDAFVLDSASRGLLDTNVLAY